MLGDFPVALNACSEGLRMDPDDAELHFRHRAEARRLWRTVLNACPGDPKAMSRGELSR
jgi:hypothetical protein